MEWIEFYPNNPTSYPPQDEPVLISYWDGGQKVGLAILRYRGKYGGYYWWGEYGFEGMSVLKGDQSYEYKPWLDVEAWMPLPKPYE